MNRVVTLSESQFPEACRKLAEDVIRSGFEFDILVGIASGGWYVAKHMAAPVRLSVTLRRASTATKKKLLPSLLKYLPRPVCDMLRIAESRFYGLLSHLRKPQVSSIDLSDEMLDTLRSRPDARILIVDDARRFRLDSADGTRINRRGTSESRDPHGSHNPDTPHTAYPAGL